MIVVAPQQLNTHDNLELSRGRLIASTDSPARAKSILATLRQHHGHEPSAPLPVDRAVLTSVHTAEYVDFLATAWARWIERDDPAPAAMGFAWPARPATSRRPTHLLGQLGYHSFAADCSITSHTWEAALESASVAATAARQVADGAPVAYGLCRPPGHHATADQFGGYCFLNNAAIAATMLRSGGHGRVAVLDVDYHHGNGTQAIFFARDDVLTVSIHADPTFEFPWFSGHADEVGIDAGEGWNMNLPLDAGTGFAAWSIALDAALSRIADSGATALVIALGVDTYVDDPLGTFQIATDDYATMARRIGELGLPTVVVQEGGYAVEAIGANVASFLSGLA